MMLLVTALVICGKTFPTVKAGRQAKHPTALSRITITKQITTINYNFYHGNGPGFNINETRLFLFTRQIKKATAGMSWTPPENDFSN